MNEKKPPRSEVFPNNETVRINTNLPPKTMETLRRIADESGVSMIDVVRSAVESYADIMDAVGEDGTVKIIIKGEDGTEKEVTLFVK